MDNTLWSGVTGDRIKKMLFVVTIALGVFLAAEAVSTLMSLRYIGTGVVATNTIMVSGHGEMLSVPDIATFSFSVVSEKATVTDAQSDASARANAATAYLKSVGIADKDIQTSDYSVSPQYDYQQSSCPVSTGTPTYCPPNRQVLHGYVVRQTTTVKVRAIAKAGEMLAGVGGKGATEVSGLSFTFDDPTKVASSAREKAITDAKAKAKVLAGQLGVSLVRVVSFNESGNAAFPVYGMSAKMADVSSPPEISVGQNKIQTDVTITYEIR